MWSDCSVLQDILRCRARTTGIIETVIDVKSHKLHMLDVGGQKSERRKWIHCFSDVTSILFLVSLSGYDQCLVEDKDAVRFPTFACSCAGPSDGSVQNQMQDAMAIWDQICHSQWFKNTSIVSAYILASLFVALIIVAQILFLNKVDLFTEKIPHSHIRTVFPVSFRPLTSFASTGGIVPGCRLSVVGSRADTTC